MFVCLKCDGVVGQPQKRWWSRWRYWANGHVLYVRGLGPSLERSFWASFMRGMAESIVIFGVLIVAVLAPPEAPPHYQAAPTALVIGMAVSCFYLLMSMSLLKKARIWAGRSGPLQRLVTHAKGRACGFLAAITCQLGIMIALLLAK